MLITEEYRELNRQCHEGAGWGKGGTRWIEEIKEFATDTKSHLILDYGCGKGALVRELNKAGYDTTGYDPAVGDFPHTRDADLVVCTDVLEHVEPDCISAVLYDIEDLAHKAVYLVIALKPAVKVLSNGENAHCLIRPVHWWIDVLDLHFGRAKEFEMKVGSSNMEWKWVRP